MGSTETLPRIACFHGGGCTAEIYAFQAEAVRHQLCDTFEFVFFNGPYERSAGPGVLPFFNAEKYSPYLSWFDNDSNGVERVDGGPADGSGESGIQRAVRLMKECGPGGEWVGCMGFSQGTRMVGGLLHEQQRLVNMGIPGLGGGEIQFKFGILCMGSFGPMLNNVKDLGRESMISIPTLHMHGLKDGALQNGRRMLAKYYDPLTSVKLEINYHHAMPWFKADVLKLGGMIRLMYADTM